MMLNLQVFKIGLDHLLPIKEQLLFYSVVNIVMKSGSKSRVRVTGSSRVRATIFGFLSRNYNRVTLRFLGFATINI